MIKEYVDYLLHQFNIYLAWLSTIWGNFYDRLLRIVLITLILFFLGLLVFVVVNRYSSEPFSTCPFEQYCEVRDLEYLDYTEIDFSDKVRISCLLQVEDDFVFVEFLVNYNLIKDKYLLCRQE